MNFLKGSLQLENVKKLFKRIFQSYYQQQSTHCKPTRCGKELGIYGSILLDKRFIVHCP